MFKTLEVWHRAGALWIALNRPQVLNAIDATMMQELTEAIDHALRQTPVAIVFTGRGRAFCAGADLAWARQFARDRDSHVRALFTRMGEALQRLERSSVPAIAAVNGVCVAGGCELLLACDLAVAAESAVIGDAHANYGLIPAGGATVRLPLLVGMRNAKRLLFLGELISAREAQQIGLVNWVVPDDRLESRVDEIVAALEAKGPLALGRIKALTNLAWRTAYDVVLELERDQFFAHLTSDEVAEGLRAFQEKRKPRFRDLS